jgi:hypothetical protein
MAAAQSITIKTTNAGQMSSGSPALAAATLIDDNGTTLIGVDASNHGVLNKTTPLPCPATGEWSLTETVSVSFTGGGSPAGAINCNGIAATDSGVSRTVTGAFTLGSTPGGTNFCNCTIVSLDVYPSTQTFPPASPPPPMLSMTVDFVGGGAYSGSGIYRASPQCGADSWAPTVGPGGVMYSPVDDSRRSAARFLEGRPRLSRRLRS